MVACVPGLEGADANSAMAVPVGDVLEIQSIELTPGASSVGWLPNFSNNGSKTASVNASAIQRILETSWGTNVKVLPPHVLFQDSVGENIFSVTGNGCSVNLVDSRETSRQLLACLLAYRIADDPDDSMNIQDAAHYANILSGSIMTLMLDGRTENSPILADHPTWLGFYESIQNDVSNWTMPVEVQ